MGGTDEESLESIKLNAPKSFSAQERAITKDDYDVILSQGGYNANVWGGDKEYAVGTMPTSFGEPTADFYTTNNWGLEVGDIDLFLGGIIPPYYTNEIRDTLEQYDYISEIYDDMIWELYNPPPLITSLQPPLEDTSGEHWKLTHQPRVGYVFLTGFNIDGSGNKIKYSNTDVINFRSFIQDTKVITLKVVPQAPNIIDYNLNIQVQKVDNFLGNGQELINEIKADVLEYWNANYEGWNEEIVKSRLVKEVMSNANIDYCTIDFTNSAKFYEPYDLSSGYLTLRFYNQLEPGSIYIIKDSTGAVVASDDGSGKMLDDSDVEISESRESISSVPSQYKHPSKLLKYQGRAAP